MWFLKGTGISFICRLCLLLTLSCTILAKDENCPPAEDIAPCECEKKPPHGLFLKCSKLTDDKEMARIMSAAKGRFYFTVTIFDSSVGTLRSDLFHGMRIHSIDLRLAGMTSLVGRGGPMFHGLEISLIGLVVDGTFIDTPLTQMELGHMRTLNYLAISFNDIDTIPDHWFKNGPYGIRSLFITNNRINSVDSKAFAPLRELAYFWLVGNNLNKISRDILPNPAYRLQEINLSHNRFESLPADMFSNMPVLTKLTLQENGFLTISEATFGSLWSQLKNVDFVGNVLICDRRIKWIYDKRRPEIFDGVCAQPESLVNTLLPLVKKDDLK